MPRRWIVISPEIHRRAALAQWLARPDNSFTTASWSTESGGIISFGHRRHAERFWSFGEKPTPRVVDWMANISSSTTERQSDAPAHHEFDWRQSALTPPSEMAGPKTLTTICCGANVRRLEAEQIRVQCGGERRARSG
jgi:hypothetical protein